ncbi:MAG: hypothetical protein AB7S74_05415 [Hyphomicrobium sp.]
MPFRSILPVAFGFVVLLQGAALAASPKLDKDTCDQLQAEQAKFMQSGIMSDIEKGAAWGKANLSAERLREVEHFILLDEQVKFGCRVVSLTDEGKKVEEAAKRLELNPNLDPTLPPPPKKPTAKSTDSKSSKSAPKPADAPKSGDTKPPASAKKSSKPASSGASTQGKSSAASGNSAPPVQVQSAPVEPAPPAKTRSSDAYKPPRSQAFKPPAFVE